MKYFFVYRGSSILNRPDVEICHGYDPNVQKTVNKDLGRRILASHEIPEGELHDAVARGDCPWAALRVAFPPPVEEA